MIEEFVNDKILGLVDRLGIGCSLVFDVDGTLFETNTANNLAYQKAYRVVTQNSMACISLSGRINEIRLRRSELFQDNLLHSMVEMKKQYFSSYLHCIKISDLRLLLDYLYGKVPMYIASDADGRRVDLLLYNFGIQNYFNGIVCKNNVESYGDKYDCFVNRYRLDKAKMIVVEDSDVDIKNAIHAGVCPENILKYKMRVLMNTFNINANSFLATPVLGYYSCEYIGMNHLGNPDYINYLKNQANNFPLSLLRNAVGELTQVLTLDLPAVLKQSGLPSLMVCVIPRAGANSCYSQNQLLFSDTISNVVNSLSASGQNFVNGVGLIVRHTSTQTTHLASTQWHPTGETAPYPGITKATCVIDPQVQGKDILLIDDIYTPGVGIDEDAIQALLDNGARSVIFYCVGKTTH